MSRVTGCRRIVTSFLGLHGTIRVGFGRSCTVRADSGALPSVWNLTWSSRDAKDTLKSVSGLRNPTGISFLASKMWIGSDLQKSI